MSWATQNSRRLNVIKRRSKYLTARLADKDRQQTSYDRAEEGALKWVIGQLGKMEFVITRYAAHDENCLWFDMAPCSCGLHRAFRAIGVDIPKDQGDPDDEEVGNVGREGESFGTGIQGGSK